ncbi:hypothetical protein HDU67_008615 [Dinochytrium kinnereticum]|nr:hypothetical protein HDU67_008615 [Dinochytrium kinnereticum]
MLGGRGTEQTPGSPTSSGHHQGWGRPSSPVRGRAVPGSPTAGSSSTEAWGLLPHDHRIRSENVAEPVLSNGDGKFKANPPIPVLSIPDVSFSSDSLTSQHLTDIESEMLPPPVAPRPTTQKLKKARRQISASSFDPEEADPDRVPPRGSPFALLSTSKRGASGSQTGGDEALSPTSRAPGSPKRKGLGSPKFPSLTRPLPRDSSPTAQGTSTSGALVTLPSPASSSRPESPVHPVSPSTGAPKVPVKDSAMSPQHLPMTIAAWFRQHTGGGSRSSSPDPNQSLSSSPTKAVSKAVVDVAHPPPAGYLTHSPSNPSLREEALAEVTRNDKGKGKGRDSGRRASSLGPYDSLRGTMRRAGSSSDVEDISFRTAESGNIPGMDEEEDVVELQRPPSPDGEVPCGCPKHPGVVVCEVVFDLPVQVLFDAIFEEGGSPVVHEAHRKRLTSVQTHSSFAIAGPVDLTFGEWKDSDRGTRTRKITYKYAFKAILVGKISTPCFEEQEILKRTDL